MRFLAKHLRLTGFVVAISLAASAALGLQGTAWADTPISVDLDGSASSPITDGVSLDPTDISGGGVTADLGQNGTTNTVAGAATSTVNDPTNGALTLPDAALKADSGAIDNGPLQRAFTGNGTACATIGGGSCDPAATGGSSPLPGILVTSGDGASSNGLAANPAGNGNACLTVGPASCSSSNSGPAIAGFLLPSIVSTSGASADGSPAGGGSAAGNSGNCLVVGAGSCSGGGTGSGILPDIISNVGVDNNVGSTPANGSGTGQVCTVIGVGACGSTVSQDPPVSSGPLDPGDPSGIGGPTGNDNSTDVTSPVQVSSQAPFDTTFTTSIDLTHGTQPVFDNGVGRNNLLPLSGRQASSTAPDASGSAGSPAARDATSPGTPPRSLVSADAGSVAPPRTGDGGLLGRGSANRSSAFVVLLAILVIASLGLPMKRSNRR